MFYFLRGSWFDNNVAISFFIFCEARTSWSLKWNQLSLRRATDSWYKLAREVQAADMSNLQAVIYWVRILRIVRLEAFYIGGKQAREVKVAHINNLQAVIY